jgi:hypothetical protein
LLGQETRSSVAPWHVLGEEVTAQGTSRFVDSSVERMQVKVNGMLVDRFLEAVADTGSDHRVRHPAALDPVEDSGSGDGHVRSVVAHVCADVQGLPKVGRCKRIAAAAHRSASGQETGQQAGRKTRDM